MKYKQEIIKDLIEQLSNIEKESSRTALQHFKAWLKQLQVLSTKPNSIYPVIQKIICLRKKK